MSDDGKAALKEIVGAIDETVRLKFRIKDLVKAAAGKLTPGTYLVGGRIVKVVVVGTPDGVRVETVANPVEVIS